MTRVHTAAKDDVRQGHPRRRVQLFVIGGLATVVLHSLINHDTASAKGLTRAQVLADMAEFEAAGFNPAHPNPATWVEDAQRAAARVSSERNGKASENDGFVDTNATP